MIFVTQAYGSSAGKEIAFQAALNSTVGLQLPNGGLDNFSIELCTPQSNFDHRHILTALSGQVGVDSRETKRGKVGRTKILDCLDCNLELTLDDEKVVIVST